jgi:hypothetical protein
MAVPPPPMMAEDLAEAPLIFLADENQLWVHALLVFQQSALLAWNAVR